MNYTTGLILLFLNIFLPGILFLRFYFKGEFSKQFTTRIPFARLFFYSLIPGLIIQVIGLTLYDWYDDKFTILHSLEVFSDLMKGSGEFSKESKHFFENKISQYVCYTFLTCLFSIISSTTIYFIVRRFDLDIKFKMLRFRNQWYYVFSGDVLRFEKYKLATIDLQRNQNYEDRGIMVSYADILVSNNGNTKMYSGYVVDYELNAKNIQDLDKIYMLGVQKCKYNDENENTFDKKDIPGDLFVIDNSQVININVTYVPSLHKKRQKEDKKLRQKKIISTFINWLALIIVIAVLLQLFFQPFRISILNYLTYQLNLVQKLLFFFATSSLFSAILIKHGNSTNRKYIILGTIIINTGNILSVLYTLCFR